MLVALAAMLAPSRARAQDAEPLDLRWNAPAGCPSEASVRHRIAELAGSARSTEPALRAEATITRSDDGQLHLELVVRAGDLVGTRHLDARSCDDLAGATAVALALLLRSPEALSEEDLVGRETSTGDASDAAGQSKTERESESGTEPSAKAAPPAPKPSAAPPRSSAESTATRSWRGLVQAPLAAFGLGPLPAPSLGVSAAAGVSIERWRFLVAGSVWRTQRITASEEPGASADVALVAAGLNACWAALEGDLGLGPCATLLVEHVGARGDGDHVAPRSAGATWLAAGAGAQAFWHLAPWFGLVGALGGQIEGSRPRIAIDEVGTLGQIRPVSITLTAGVEWIL